MKADWNGFLKKLLFLILASIVLSGVGYLIALAISYFWNFKMTDVLCFEGLIIIILGLFSSMKGNHSGINLNGLGQSNAQYIAYQNTEITAQEQKITNYHKNFRKNAIVDFGFSTIAIVIIGGILLLLSVIS